MNSVTGHRLAVEGTRTLPQVWLCATEHQSCPVLFEIYRKGNFPTALPCDHFFHVHRLAWWLQRQSVCGSALVASLRTQELARPLFEATRFRAYFIFASHVGAGAPSALGDTCPRTPGGNKASSHGFRISFPVGRARKVK